jgi:Na+/serine symporter
MHESGTGQQVAQLLHCYDADEMGSTTEKKKATNCDKYVMLFVTLIAATYFCTYTVDAFLKYTNETQNVLPLIFYFS